MEELSWKELLRVVDSARSSSQKCTIRVLDTVFVDREDANDISWYFTTKNGTISKKKKDKCTLAGICERFSRFSLANPHNVEGIVCSVIGADGGRRYLTQTEMNTFVNARDLTIPAGSFLQVYLRPIGGSAHVVRATCIVEPTGRKAITVTSENIIGPMGVWGHEPKELAVEAKDQAKYFCHELSNFFSNESTGYTVTEFEIECVLDDNKHLWLSSVPHCSVSSIAETTGAPALPGLIKQNRSIGGSAPGSPRANSSEGRGVVSTAPGSLPASKLVSRIEGGAVHCCARGPEDLPGLRAWIAVAMHQDQGRSGDKTKLRWFVDVTAYNGGTSPNPHKVSIFEQRAVMRKSVPHSMLSLLKLAEPILLGSEHIDTEIDFISRWKFIFGAWVASQRVVSQVSGETDALSEGDIERILQHSNHVTVDGNCHAICQKLESLVEAEFSVSSPSPMATTGGSRGTSAGCSDRATKTDSDAVKASNCITEVTMDRRQILSAGNDGGYPVAAPPLQPYAAQWDNDNVSIVSSIGDASVVKAATRNKLLEHNPPKYKVHREDSPESAIRGAKKPNVNSLKVKKKKPIIKQPPAEKMVTPDMELLGKFAAEKDK